MEALPPNPRSTESYACSAVSWRSARRCALEILRMVAAVLPALRICEFAGGGCRPPHPHFLLRSVCFADGSLPRSTRRLAQVGANDPAPPLSAALSLSCRRLATAGNEALGRWGLPPPPPRFPLRSACLADGSLPRATKFGLSCRELATMGIGPLGRRGLLPPHPRFPLRSACLADGSLPRATQRLRSFARICALAASIFSRR